MANEQPLTATISVEALQKYVRMTIELDAILPEDILDYRDRCHLMCKGTWQYVDDGDEGDDYFIHDEHCPWRIARELEGHTTR